MYDEIIEELELEEESNPYKVLGFPTTFPLLGRVIATMVSLGGALAQKYSMEWTS